MSDRIKTPPAESGGSELFDKPLWIKCLCAWNNVPPDNAAMTKYADEAWGKVSQEGWKRVAKAVHDHIINTRAEPQPDINAGEREDVDLYDITDNLMDEVLGKPDDSGTYDVDSGNIQALVARVFEALRARKESGQGMRHVTTEESNILKKAILDSSEILDEGEEMP